MDELAHVQVERRGRVLVAKLRGEIDISNVRDVTRAVTEAASNDDIGLIADLSDVTYLDSTGIRLLFDLDKQLRDHQQRLTLIVPGGSTTRRLLEIFELDSRVPVHPTVERALASLDPTA